MQRLNLPVRASADRPTHLPGHEPHPLSKAAARLRALTIVQERASIRAPHEVGARECEPRAISRPSVQVVDAGRVSPHNLRLLLLRTVGEDLGQNLL